MSNPFPDTPVLCGSLRRPRQMRAEQPYDGHMSIHDHAMAKASYAAYEAAELGGAA